MAVSLALTTPEGLSAVAVGYDSEYGSTTVSYSVYHDTRKNVFEVKPNSEYRFSNRILTATEAIELETARRATLKTLYEAALADAQAQAAAYNAQKEAESHESHLRSATRFLEENAEFAALPEVAAVQALVDAGDVKALTEYNSQTCSRPTDRAENAVRRAKKARELAKKKEWVLAYGSERTQRLAKEGLNFDSEYQEELLALEMPGWKYGGEYPSDRYRKPTLGELRLLDTARQGTSAPSSEVGSEEATLRWVGSYDKGVYRPGRRFSGRDVYLDQAPVKDDLTPASPAP